MTAMENDAKNQQETNPFETLLADKELLSRLSDLAKNLKLSMGDATVATNAEAENPSSEADTSPTSPLPADAMSAVLSNPALMAKLPEVMAALSPGKGTPSIKKAPPDKRTALLLALRPYLSESRCEAIDYITRLGKISDLLKNLNLQ